MRFLVWRSLLVSALFAASAGRVWAQWTDVAPNLLQDADARGAMQFKSGVAWAGVHSLWSSLDSGKTWLPCQAFPIADISDIAFYDKLHGLVATEDQGLFVTIDGGLSWLQELNGKNLVKVGYNGSNSSLLALDIDGPIYTSNDGGATWQGSGDSGKGTFHSFATAANRTIYVDGFADTGSVLVSADLGVTWNPTTGTYNGDCWSMAVDSCDPKRLYLTNEENATTSDPNSNFYLSVDGGQTWQITDSHPRPYLSGSISTTTDGVFVGSRDGSGVHRSMDQGVTWKSIGGPDNGPDTRNIAAINDNIILAADTAGNIWLTTNGGGDSVQSVRTDTVSFAEKTLFSADTLACDSVQQWVHIVRAGCPLPSLDSIAIAGPDSANFQIDSVTNDSLLVTVFPRKVGTQNAWLVGRYNGRNDTVQLSGFVDTSAGTFSVAPDSLFSTDTLHCDSAMRSVFYTSNGCRPPVPNMTIAGPDSSSFHIRSITKDSVSITLLPQKMGTQQAWLVAELNNGTSDSVALGGFSSVAPLAYSAAPQSLFSSDSLFVACDPATPALMRMIATTPCPWPNIVSERIVGPDSEDYTISTSIGSPIASADSVTIVFQPTDTGIRMATYELTLDDGTTITIPLSGVGLATHTLTLTAASSNWRVDTIGDSIAVPITVNGLARAENVELVLHYPLGDLVYDSSVDRSGAIVDIPGEQWPGRSKLRIVNAQPGAVAAYARFYVYSDTDYNPLVTFDSVSVPTSLGPCEYSLPPAITDTIVPLEGCAIQMLSLLVHFGQTPVFGIRPNPTTDGAFELTSSLDLGDVRIEAYDALGMERGQFPMTLNKNIPTPLSLPFESGIYFLRIVSPEGEAHLSVMVTR
jgi:photosystem II stability/assembly factor-like uncharacterized protein